MHTQTTHKTQSVPGTAAGLLDQHRHRETLIQYTQLAIALLQIIRVHNIEKNKRVRMKGTISSGRTSQKKN